MTLRIRTNVAWLMRGIAKRLNVRANAIDPIKILPSVANVDRVPHEVRFTAEGVPYIVFTGRRAAGR